MWAAGRSQVVIAVGTVRPNQGNKRENVSRIFLPVRATFFQRDGRPGSCADRAVMPCMRYGIWKLGHTVSSCFVRFCVSRTLHARRNVRVRVLCWLLASTYAHGSFMNPPAGEVLSPHDLTCSRCVQMIFFFFGWSSNDEMHARRVCCVVGNRGLQLPL